MLYLICLVISLFVININNSYASLPDFTVMAERVSPSVVNISTYSKREISSKVRPHDLQDGETWGELLDKHKHGQPPRSPSTPLDNAESLGSGFILDHDGYIITNYHVIVDATEIIVKLTDRREFIATVIGVDARSDVALLKIDATNLQPVKIGDSSELKKGQWVMAIGAPFGFESSVSVGVISYIGRKLPSESYVPYLQTDVAINPGNSGGPLFDLDGEVIGINSQIYSRTGGFMGLSFAIPIDVAIDVVKQLRTKGHVSRGWLGLFIEDVDKTKIKELGLNHVYGAVVVKVIKDSPAEQAGFKNGDVVTHFAGIQIYNSRDLPLAVGNAPVGEDSIVMIVRDGKPMSITVVIGELPSEEKIRQGGFDEDGMSPIPDRDAGRLALKVEDLTTEARIRLNTPAGGALVTEVYTGPGSKAGVRRGDVILKIGRTMIDNATQCRDVISKLPNNHSVSILILRQGVPVFLSIKLAPDK